MLNLNIDISKNRIEFLDNRFYATPNGGFVPSVTTILEAYPKDAGYFKWIKEVGADADTIRDEAGRRGSTVHELTELYDSGHVVSILTDMGFPKFKMSEWSMFERYVEFTTQFNPTIDMMEAHMVSEKLGYAGTLDRVIQLDGKTILLDIKTSNQIYPSYWLQLAAYNELLKEAGVQVDSYGILWLNAKTRSTGKNGAIQGHGWQLVTKDNLDAELVLFNTTKTLWEALNEDIKPKQLSYQIKHQRNG